MIEKVRDCVNCGEKICYVDGSRDWNHGQDTCLCRLGDEQAAPDVIERLAAIGARERAVAAYERGVRDCLRMKRGEITPEELTKEFNADPP